MNNITELFEVLSDETRLRIINLLSKQQLCVCELVEILDLSQPKISKHIARLRQIKLVETDRNEQYIYYSLNKENEDYNKIISSLLSIKNETFDIDTLALDNIESFVCTR